MMTRAFTALLAAAAGCLLFVSAGALGVAAVLVNLITPLPATMAGMRCGPRWGVAAVGLTAAAVAAITGDMSVVLYLVQFGLPAMLLPWLLGRGVSWDRAIVMALGLMLAAGIVVLLGVASGSGQSAFTVIDSLVDREIDQAITMMQEMAGTEGTAEETEAFRQMVAGMGDLMRRGYPAMLVVVGAVMQLVTVGLLAMLSRPRGLPGPAFATWRSPEPLIWVLIASGFGVAFSAGALQDLALNLLIVLLPVYFLQGLAVLEHFLGRRHWSPLLRAMSYLLVLVINPMPVIVTGVGVFDLWADFRKPRPKPT